MESWTQSGGRRLVTIEETLAAEVMEVSMSRQAGTFFAIGTTARALRVTPDWAKREIVSFSVKVFLELKVWVFISFSH